MFYSPNTSSSISCSVHVFTSNWDIKLRSYSGVFCEVWVFLGNDILFLRQKQVNNVEDILKEPIFLVYVSFIFFFFLVLNQHF